MAGLPAEQERIEADGIRCFAISSYGSEVDRAHSEAAGFDDHFTKPISIDQLRSALRGVPPG